MRVSHSKAATRRDKVVVLQVNGARRRMVLLLESRVEEFVEQL